MTVVNKIKQLGETDIPKLVALAKADGMKTDHDQALWIIAHSLHWKNQGYKKLMEEIANAQTSSQD